MTPRSVVGQLHAPAHQTAAIMSERDQRIFEHHYRDIALSVKEMRTSATKYEGRLSSLENQASVDDYEEPAPVKPATTKAAKKSSTRTN